MFPKRNGNRNESTTCICQPPAWLHQSNTSPICICDFSEKEHRQFIRSKSHSLMMIAHPEQEQQDHLDDNNETDDDDLLEEEDEEDETEHEERMVATICFIIIIIQIHHQ
jgi:hypothetical protein